MSDNRADMQVAEKIAKLDTLGAGIVFGKEEAWDKLQARMDKRPVRVIPLRYWGAVAAVLLLFIGIIAWYRSPVEEVAVRQSEINKTQIVPPPAVAPLKQETQLPAKANTIKMKTVVPGRNINVANEKIQQLAVIVPPSIMPEEHVVEEVAIVNVPAPLTPVQPMKIIHINDLEHGSYNSLPASGTAPGIALNKLPVAHINELEREAVEVKEILKNNRMTFGHIPFSRSDYDDYYFNTEGDHQRVQFLKLRNTQN
jgi:hypothetical protein